MNSFIHFLPLLILALTPTLIFASTTDFPFTEENPHFVGFGSGYVSLSPTETLSVKPEGDFNVIDNTLQANPIAIPALRGVDHMARYGDTLIAFVGNEAKSLPNGETIFTFEHRHLDFAGDGVLDRDQFYIFKNNCFEKIGKTPRVGHLMFDSVGDKYYVIADKINNIAYVNSLNLDTKVWDEKEVVGFELPISKIFEVGRGRFVLNKQVISVKDGDISVTDNVKTFGIRSQVGTVSAGNKVYYIVNNGILYEARTSCAVGEFLDENMVCKACANGASCWDNLIREGRAMSSAEVLEKVKKVEPTPSPDPTPSPEPTPTPKPSPTPTPKPTPPKRGLSKHARNAIIIVFVIIACLILAGVYWYARRRRSRRYIR